jgi:hypothetical protein
VVLSIVAAARASPSEASLSEVLRSEAPGFIVALRRVCEPSSDRGVRHRRRKRFQPRSTSPATSGFRPFGKARHSVLTNSGVRGRPL